MNRDTRRLAVVYTIEAMGSVAGGILTVGIFFYTTPKLNWGLLANFVLSAGQGILYTLGALSSHPLTNRFGWRPPLAGALLAAAAIISVAAFSPSPAVIATAALVATYFTTIIWPILESLVAGGNIDSHEMSRRIGVYNLVWAAVAGVASLASGLIIEVFPRGLFIIPGAACAVGALLAFLTSLQPPGPASASRHEKPKPEPTLARQRVIAMQLARISMPAMYVVSYALAAMIPTLAVIRDLRPAHQSLIGSLWQVARWFTFLLLGSTRFWHTRPRLLLTAAFAMLVSTLMITVPNHLPTFVAGQLILGIATGLIYTASLYFGMVLSEGSTEHGGYHEALIGLGMALGPGAGCLTQWIWPSSQLAAVSAVAGILGCTILLASITSLRHVRSAKMTSSESNS